MTTLKIFGVPVHVDHSRTERIPVDGPINVQLAANSGKIHLIASDEEAVSVQLTTVGINTEWMVEESHVEYDPTTKTLSVATPFADSSLGVRWLAGITKGYAKKGRKWLQAGSGDVSLWVQVPHDSTIEINSVSGDVKVQGRFKNAAISVVSSDVELSGSFAALAAKAVSGDFSVDSVEHGATVQTVSGDVTLNVTGTGEYAAQSISGDIEFRVQPGLSLDVDAYSLSGEVSSAIALDGSASISSAGTVAISAKTTAGDIRINRR
jgi:hypothetical protein